MLPVLMKGGSEEGKIEINISSTNEFEQEEINAYLKCMGGFKDKRQVDHFVFVQQMRAH
jgi:hypothetical protein